MKLCPTCRNTYPDDYQTCPRDQAALTSETHEIVPGTVLRGKYEVLCELGAGGMATVYKVRHKAFQELAAVKVVHSKFMQEPGFVKRFRNEAIIARQLKHPNAVRIDDFDYTEDQRPFIVMEYVEGSSLYEVRKQHGGPWPVERCINIISQAASALSAAHTLGIVHRDIKPSNILLLRGSGGEGVVKVLDFGIAKIDTSIAGMTSVLTQTDLIIGTPEYMSPEQASGHLESTIDGRADLYSLGLVFYEMLTGAHPFQSDTPMGMLVQQVHTMPAPPDSFPVQIPAAISALVLKALQKEPKDRFQSASEMLNAMRDPDAWYAATHHSSPQDAITAPINVANAVMPPHRNPRLRQAQSPQRLHHNLRPVRCRSSLLLTPHPRNHQSRNRSQLQIPRRQWPSPRPPTVPPQFAPVSGTPPVAPAAPTKSSAGIIIIVALAAVLLLAVGLFFGYRMLMSRIKGPEQATAVTQTTPPAAEAPDTKANVTKLVGMGNDALANKQYDLAAAYFQQAVNLDPQSAEAKTGLDNAHAGAAAAAKPAEAAPTNPAPANTAKTPPAPDKTTPPVEKPKPVKTGPLKVPPGVMFANLISSPAPVYPPVAKTAHIQGEVTLHAIISKTGEVKQVEPISGLKIFHESAINAVQQWRYKPYLVNNVPTDVDTTITVSYAIAHK